MFGPGGRNLQRLVEDAGPQVEIVGRLVFSRPPRDQRPLARGQTGLQRGGDLLGERSLNREDVGDVLAVGLGPQVSVRLGVD